MYAMTTITAGRRALPAAIGVIVACLMGVGVAATLTGAIPLPGPLALPAPLIAAGIVLLAVSPILIRRWRTTFWILIAWLVVEDLVRKLLGNNIALYFAKDLIYFFLLIGFAIDPAVRGSWRRATGSARLAFYAMVVWALIMAIPSGFQDWRLPVIGLRLDFLYVPLVLVGFTMAGDRAGLRRLLSGLTTIGLVGCLVGIAQGVIGPDFLRPSVPTPGLTYLELIRAGGLFQPSGTFADPGRFGALALMTLVTALALFLMAERTNRRLRVFAGGSILIAVAACWVHAGKTGLLLSGGLFVLAFAAPSFASKRPVVGRGVAAGGAIVAALLLFTWLFPALTQGRVQYFRGTLDPGVSTNEWSFRKQVWVSNTLAGLRLGGAFGEGTGVAALGRQYLYGEGSSDPLAASLVEGGYAVVLQEWGAVGLALWLAWTLAWVRRQWRGVLAARGTTVAAGGLVILGWMVAFLFLAFVQGFQGFQNYNANAYFWLLSGAMFALPVAARPRSESSQVDRVPASVSR